MEELYLTYFKMNPQEKTIYVSINSSALRIDLLSNIRKPIKKERERENINQNAPVKKSDTL